MNGIELLALHTTTSVGGLLQASMVLRWIEY